MNLANGWESYTSAGARLKVPIEPEIDWYQLGSELRTPTPGGLRGVISRHFEGRARAASTEADARAMRSAAAVYGDAK